MSFWQTLHTGGGRLSCIDLGPPFRGYAVPVVCHCLTLTITLKPILTATLTLTLAGPRRNGGIPEVRHSVGPPSLSLTLTLGEPQEWQTPGMAGRYRCVDVASTSVSVADIRLVVGILHLHMGNELTGSSDHSSDGTNLLSSVFSDVTHCQSCWTDRVHVFHDVHSP